MLAVLAGIFMSVKWWPIEANKMTELCHIIVSDITSTILEKLSVPVSLLYTVVCYVPSMIYDTHDVT